MHSEYVAHRNSFISIFDIVLVLPLESADISLHVLQRADMKRKAEQQDVRMKFFTDNIQLEGAHKGVKYMRGVVDQVLLQFLGKYGL